MTNIGVEFKQTQGEQYMDRIELKEKKNKNQTYFGIENSYGNGMEKDE